MLIVVQRDASGELSIPGEMLINNTHFCWTLENKADAIPEGIYPITIYDSPHLGKPVPLVNDVPGRSYIEIHWGNFPANYKGCIGVGESRDTSTEEIFYTQEAFQRLFPLVEQAIAREGCQLQVISGITNAEAVRDAATGED